MILIVSVHEERWASIIIATTLWLCTNDVPTYSYFLKSDVAKLIITVRSCTNNLPRDNESWISIIATVVSGLDVYKRLRRSELIIHSDIGRWIGIDCKLLIIIDLQLVLLGPSSHSWVGCSYPSVFIFMNLVWWLLGDHLLRSNLVMLLRIPQIVISIFIELFKSDLKVAYLAGLRVRSWVVESDVLMA